MKANVVSRITIAASRAETFRYLADLKYLHLWNPHLRSVSPINKIKLGSRYKSLSVVLGVDVRGDNRVTKFIGGKELEIENSTGTLHYLVNYKLLNDRGRTKLVCSTAVSAKGDAFAFVAPVLKLLARRELQSDLQALKIVVEQGLEP